MREPVTTAFLPAKRVGLLVGGGARSQSVAPSAPTGTPGLSATEEPPASLRSDTEVGGGAASSGTTTATHFLLYLNDRTYRDEVGDRLAEELRRARAASLPIVMAHENVAELGGCDFALFFTTTPQVRQTTPQSKP